MAKGLFPDTDVKNVFELGVDFFIRHAIDAVVFDIDNTLVTHDTKTPPEDIVNYLRLLSEAGIKVAIVSNNHKERVDLFCAGMEYPYIARAWKPFKKHLCAMEKILGCRPDKICLVGDQIFTDIYGANRRGYLSVLVTALGENETRLVALKRIFESLVLFFYRRHKEKQVGRPS